MASTERVDVLHGGAASDLLGKGAVPDQPVLLAGAPSAWPETGIDAWLRAQGWSSAYAVDAARARWLAAIQKVSLVLIAGDDELVESIIRATRPVTRAPIVVLSAAGSDAVVAMLGAGVDGVVDPLTTIEEIVARVDALMRRSDDHAWPSGARHLRAAG